MIKARESDKKQRSNARSLLSESETTEIRNEDTKQRRVARSLLSNSFKDVMRTEDKLQHRETRSLLSVEEVQTNQKQNALQHRLARNKSQIYNNIFDQNQKATGSNKKRSIEDSNDGYSSDEVVQKKMIHFASNDSSQNALFAIYNALQERVIGPIQYSKLINDRTLLDSQNVLKLTKDPIDVAVVKDILNENGFDLTKIDRSEWEKALLKGVFLARHYSSYKWSAYHSRKYSSQIIHLDPTLSKEQLINSFPEALCFQHDLYELKKTITNPKSVKKMRQASSLADKSLTKATSSLSISGLDEDSTTTEEFTSDEEYQSRSDEEKKQETMSKEFAHQVQLTKLRHCEFCSELLPSEKRVEKVFRCNSCAQVVRRKECFWTTDAGDPGKMPTELKNIPLSFVEEQLIALVCVNQYIYHRRAGAIASKGHCIHFLQNIGHIAKVLPRLPEDVPIVIIQKKDWKGEITKDLRVRRAVVKSWLEYLKNNSLILAYRELEIDYVRVDALPEDGMLEGIEIIQTDEEIESVNTFERDSVQDERPDVNDMNPSFDSAVPFAPPENTGEDEAIKKAVNDLIGGNNTTLSKCF